ncbi:MAG: mannitol dehydrogenase family protein [Sphingorhabdus sp.]
MMHQRLNASHIDELPAQVARPAYARDNIGVGILHLGAGAFFKAHQAVYTDTALGLASGDWGICAASLNSETVKEALVPQDCLYTLKLLGEPESYRVIGSIAQVLAGPDDRAKIIEKISDPQIKIMTLTITEKGYCLEPSGALDFAHPDIAEDLKQAGPPRSAIGVLVAGLKMRFGTETSPITVISCDNISGNGTKLRGAVIAFAQRLDAEFAERISKHVIFPNTMVDSITPAGDAPLLESVTRAIGFEDQAAVHREKFSDWVIEDFDGPRPAWGEAGAVFASDVTPYETAKLRLVNAPHSALAYLGLLAGYTTVAQVMADEELTRYFYGLTQDELIPSLGDSPIADLAAYRDRIGQRFANPLIHHELRQIAADGSAKLPQRLLPPLAVNHRADRPIGFIALGIAAWMRFVLAGARKGVKLNDPLASIFSEVSSASLGQAEDDVDGLLAIEDIFPIWIKQSKDVRGAIVAAYGDLSLNGVQSALSAAEKVAA